MIDFFEVTPETEPEWLEARKHLITGSALAGLMGLSPWATRAKLTARYLGEEEFSPNRKMWWGNVMEEANGKALAKAIGGGCYFVPAHRFYSEAPFGATTDGYLESVTGFVGSVGPAVCPSGDTRKWGRFRDGVAEILESGGRLWTELKNVGQDQLKNWNQEGAPPPYYWAQCQLQMHMLGLDTMALVAKVGAADIRGHLITYDELFMDDATDKAQEFLSELEEMRKL